MEGGLLQVMDDDDEADCDDDKGDDVGEDDEDDDGDDYVRAEVSRKG